MTKNTAPDSEKLSLIKEMLEVIKGGLAHNILLVLGLTAFNLTMIATNKDEPENLEEMYSWGNLIKYGLANAAGAIAFNTLSLVSTLKAMYNQPRSSCSRGSVAAMATCAYELSTSFLGFTVFGLASGLVSMAVIPGMAETPSEPPASADSFEAQFSEFAMKAAAAGVATSVIEKLKGYFTTPDLLQLFMALLTLTYTGQLNEVVNGDLGLSDGVLTGVFDMLVDIGAVTLVTAPIPTAWFLSKQVASKVSNCIGSFFQKGQNLGNDNTDFSNNHHAIVRGRVDADDYGSINNIAAL